ncbi:MAG: hypothetical protein IPL61_18180 [Myxococcales bacterium]|nr:hypothetical protein [Myxococcales bacterium]
MLHLEDGDDVGFVHQVRRIITGALELTSPAEAYVVKIDGWFSERWFGFSHKALGALRIANHVTLRIPPFVPARVVSERYLIRAPSGTLEPADAPCGLHLEQTSTDNARRLVSAVAPQAALCWWSAQSRRDGRGALMAYLPTADGHAGWYAELANHDGWRFTRLKGTSRAEVELLARGAARSR